MMIKNSVFQNGPFLRSPDVRLAVAVLAVFFSMTICQVQADERVSRAEALISALITDIRSTVKSASENEEERISAINAVVDTYFDVEGITRFTAGRYWRGASKEQRAYYSKQFRNVLIRTASRQFDQIIGLRFLPTTSKTRGDKLILVGGFIRDNTGKLPDVEIFWRVSAIEGKPMRVIDVEIENISMLKTQRDENEAIIRRGGGTFDTLLKSLDTRLATIRKN